MAYEQDVEIPPASARAMADGLARGELVTIAGAAHGGPFTHADESIKSVLEFLART